MTGLIKRIVGDRGFAFIRGDDGQDYFFHHSGVDPAGRSFAELVEGDRVEFAIENVSPKGPRACAVFATP